jgi:hypothetical protein
MLECYALERVRRRYRNPVGPEGAKALFKVQRTPIVSWLLTEVSLVVTRWHARSGYGRKMTVHRALDQLTAGQYTH